MKPLRGFVYAVIAGFVLTGIDMASEFSGGFLVSSASAQRGPAVKGPITRPSPSRPSPGIGMTRPSFNKSPVTRPRPVRPRPSYGMTRPNYNNGLGVKPIQVRPRPGIGMTRPNYNNGQGVKPIQVRPRPSNPYPQYPDFVDTPDSVNDLRPIRPPNDRPPHFRPPHGIWGDWFWYGNIGWYHRYRIGGTTIVIVNGLPAGCRTRVRRSGQIFYKCNGIYYKARVVRGERVYEVMSLGGKATSASSALRLTKPFMRGPRVLELQQLLRRRGYNVGTPDGIFGRGTERALKRFQQDVGLTPDGVAGRNTLRQLR